MTWISNFCGKISRQVFTTLFYSLLAFNCLNINSHALDALEDDEGYLVVAANIEGYIPRNLTLSGESIFQGGYLMEELTLGNNIRIIKMNAGIYHWSKLKINKTYLFELEEDKYSLKVEAGKVNYAGHLIVNVYPQYGTADFRFVNRASQVFDEMKDCCAELLEQKSLVFNGTGADPFIDYFSELTVNEVSKNEL